MIIRYEGHSFFTLTLENGAVIATDPYGDFYQYPQRRIKADICLVSHHHHDHDGVQCVTGDPTIIDQPGVYKPCEGVRIVGVPTKHDGKGGALRGDNTFFVVEAEGLRIGHAGDLGHALLMSQIREIGALDILMLPVGGYYTIDAQAAEQTVAALRPHTVIPMHYRTKFNPDMPIAPLDGFLKLMGENPQPMPLLRVAQKDISERPGLIVMQIEGA